MDGDDVLVCRVGTRRCALPIDMVIETMRPLPVEVVAGSAEGVMGLAMIRGVATPVLDLSALFKDEPHAPQRFVTVRAAGRVVALAVDAVVGVSRIDRAALHALPPLLGDAQTSAIESIGSADNELLVVLRAARIAPSDLFLGQSS